MNPDTETVQNSGTRPAGTPSKGEVTVWCILVAAVEWLLFPGLGIVIGIILAFTRLRRIEGWSRWAPALVAALVLVVHIIGLASGVTEFETGPSSPVR